MDESKMSIPLAYMIIINVLCGKGFAVGPSCRGLCDDMCEVVREVERQTTIAVDGTVRGDTPDALP